MAKIKPQALLFQSKKKKGSTRTSLSTIVSCTIIIILIVFSLYATYRYWHNRSSNELGAGLDNFEHVKSFGEIKRPDVPTNAKEYFKGMLFNHVIKNFLIQGGRSEKAGVIGDWILKGKSNSQITTSSKHEAFMLATSEPKKDSQEFELFITTVPIPDLNDKLILFGRVTDGQDVVQEIEEVDTDEHYRPNSPVGIIDIVLKHEA